jgi:hypothetical protein
VTSIIAVWHCIGRIGPQRHLQQQPACAGDQRRELHLQRLRALQAQQAGLALAEAQAVGFGQEILEAQADHLGRGRRQHFACQAVGRHDQVAAAEGHETDRRALEQIGITVARLFQRHLRLPQLFVLGFQLDLVHRQLVQQAVDVGAAQRLALPLLRRR